VATVVRAAIQCIGRHRIRGQCRRFRLDRAVVACAVLEADATAAEVACEGDT